MIIIQIHSSGDAVLFNAEQSIPRCYSSGPTCYNASRAIDGDWSTFSATPWVIGPHWLQVSMSNMTVYQIELLAGAAYTGEKITVSLYSGETLSGQCQSYRSSVRATVSCDRVAADRVRLTLGNTKKSYLFVWEIRVTGALTETIGL